MGRLHFPLAPITTGQSRRVAGGNRTAAQGGGGKAAAKLPISLFSLEPIRRLPKHPKVRAEAYGLRFVVEWY